MGIIGADPAALAKEALYGKNEQPEATRHNDDKAKEGKSASANQSTNCCGEANSKQETLELLLLGYPRLKAKICINVLNIGPDASGKWYVQTVEQGWSVEHGYLTKAMCIRGTGGNSGSENKGVGSGASGGAPTGR